MSGKSTEEKKNRRSEEIQSVVYIEENAKRKGQRMFEKNDERATSARQLEKWKEPRGKKRLRTKKKNKTTTQGTGNECWARPSGNMRERTNTGQLRQKKKATSGRNGTSEGASATSKEWS